TKSRLLSTCQGAFENWLHEKLEGIIRVIPPVEQSFDLQLPSGRRYGGRFDQIVDWNGKLWVRDFKTTSMMGAGFGKRFDPNNQLTGYVWAASQLSGRRVEGVMIEVVYNTKTRGPEYHPFLSTRTRNQVDEWVVGIEHELSVIDGYFQNEIFPKRTSSCNDFAGCFFRDACRKDSWYTRQLWLEESTIESVWDFMNPDKEVGVRG
ncbi:unnamed protein product, partial [marine sediment metagenome]